MSSLIVASDLDLMMLEISIEQLMVPRVTDFDSALLKKTVVMFRLLDKDWTSVYPQRTDYHVYRGTNSEVEPFNGGVSVVFPLPQSSLDVEMEKIDLQLHVHRELSKYFELQSSQSVGIACIDVSDLFNGVIVDLKTRNDRLAREPVAKSSKNTYSLVKEDGTESGAEMTVYLRLTHLGHSVISEIDVPENPKRLFYAREETSDNLPYQFKEITIDELTGGCWGSDTLLPPKDPRDTICCCDSKDFSKSLKDSSEKPEDSSGKPKDSSERPKDSSESKDPTKSVTKEDDGGQKNGKKGPKSNDSKKKKGGGKGTGKHGKGDVDGNEDENENESGGEGGTVGDEGDDDGGEGTVSCLVKPMLCGREGTCNKKDKKGRFGECGKPDGEGGNPLACGERRKCARRKMAAGSATVGIVDKKIPCPPPRLPNVCLCPIARTCPPPWSPCSTTSTPCSSCQPVYYPSSYSSPSRTQNLYHSYETPGYLYGSAPAAAAAVAGPEWGQTHVGWR